MLESHKFMLRSEDGPHTRRLTLEIEKVEENISEIRLLTQEAIDALEEKKRKLRKQTDPNAAYSKETEDIDRQILDITGHQDYILKELRKQHAEFTERKLSIERLDRALAEMDREISKVQAQHDQILAELEQKKKALRQRLLSLEKLDLLINVLTYKIFEAQHDYRSDMEALHKQKEELLKRTDLTKSQMALALAELDLKIADRTNMHEAAMMSLEGQRTELRKESALKSEHMDTTMEALKMQHDMMLTELEAQKLGATQSEIEEIDRRIAELRRMYDKDVENLKQLQEQGWRDLDSEERLSAILESRGLRVTPSGNFLTASGRLLTRSEASCLGLLEGIEPSSWNSILQGHRDLGKTGSEASLTQASSTISTETRMSSEDIHYLKTALGKPLTLALAEITAKQPKDPIHYLGHWLFKYRYNQEVDVFKKQEIQELMNERDRLEKEKINVLLQDEAHKVIMDMVIKAEEEVIRNELERIAREAAMLQAEDEGLHRDVLGAFSGPAVGAT
ncbi:hypothetical protein ILUMI_23205 [Ignelater luminosus]|uniref:Uncharacterized protein n=1 Tax=Ignelater luminosus TaxID=2038154 RepID=A0A8K0CCX5_IGNLU|nr:hypothetical protein ILUMI_23205 [Ignelater luminosus]